MKNILNFIDENEFQNFVGKIFSEELKDYQPTDGSGGDLGIDGVDGSTVYQIYCPDKTNRSKKQKYINKINVDIAKLLKNKDKLGMEITKWVLVVPEDLGTEVVAHLCSKTKETGIDCLYWGFTKLSALADKYPYIKDCYPVVFVPRINEDINEVKENLENISLSANGKDKDILTDKHYMQLIQTLRQKQADEIRSAQLRVGPSSAAQAVHYAITQKYKPKFEQLQIRKENSDRLYDLNRAKIIDKYNDKIKQINNEYAARGTYDSSYRIDAVAAMEKRKNSELDHLGIEFDKPSEQVVVEAQ